MSGAVFAGSAVRREPPPVRVWDPFVRLFHWSLVALVAVALATGDEVEWLHLWAGYAIAALVALRVIWGFVGSRHARFSDFVKPPSEVIGFLGQSLRLKAPRALGHNPAGGAMIIAMLVLIAFISVTGFMLTTDAYWGSETIKEVHEASAYTLIVLVFLHVAGVILASLEHGENLVRAMITGRKRA
jgi:cytochrome b